MPSIREKILANVADTLALIKIDNGYEVDILAVERAPRNPTNQTVLPCVQILDYGEDKEDGVPAQFVSCIIHLGILFWNDAYEDTSTRAGQIQASIERALSLDQHRNNLAIDTDIIGNEFYIEEEHLSIIGGIVKVDISYRHYYGDPYNPVAS